jgi:hypothetical protein
VRISALFESFGKAIGCAFWVGIALAVFAMAAIVLLVVAR